jgi:hypothetical protein
MDPARRRIALLVAACLFREITHGSFSYTFGWIMVALFSLMVAVCALCLHPRAGDALRGPRPAS